MRRRGFTAIELAIVVSITAILIPAVFLTARSWDEHCAAGLRHVATADEVLTVGEALRADRRTRAFAKPGTLTLEGQGACPAVEYAVTDRQTFVRRACGDEAALATHVLSAEHLRGGVALTFGFEVRPGQVARTSVFVPVAD